MLTAMKLFNKIIAPLLLSVALVSCGSSSDQVDPKRPIFSPLDTTTMTEVQKYVQNYFGKKFNVDIRYNYEDRLASNLYKLGPASEAQALKYLNLMRYTFFEVYEKVAPKGFAERHTIKQLVLFGTLGYGPTQNLLGEAPFGMIQVYDINRLNIPYFDADDYEASTFNYYYQRARDNYIQTLYHESAHTLHQDTPVPEAFLKLTISDYQQDNAFSYWYIRGISSLTAGFISDYASKSPEEDFAELYGTYMVLLPEEWEKLMVQADHKYKPDSRYTGREILERKLAIMKEYLKANYHLDIDVVRAEANRRICAMADYRKLPTTEAYYEFIKGDFSKLPPSYYSTIPKD